MELSLLRSVTLPVYTMLTAIANLCGIGASSLIGRYLGASRPQKARKVCSTALWMAAFLAFLYGSFIFFFGKTILLWTGADGQDLSYAWQFCLYAIVFGAWFSIWNTVLAQLVRSCGYPNIASMGLIAGCVLNIILDPLFIFVFMPEGMEVSAAAIATCLSNAASMLFFICFVLRHKKDSVLCFFSDEADVALKECKGIFSDRKGILKDAKEIFACGLPSFCLVGDVQQLLLK